MIFFWIYGTKSKNQQVGQIKLMSFCIAKETITNMRRQLTECNKIFANHISNKELISKIYKELKNSTAKTNDLI